MRFLKPIALSCAAAACIGLAYADSDAKTQGATEQIPLLWKVSDADNAVYLLGSFHLLKADDYPLSKDIDAAFDDAHTIVFEVEPSALTAPDTAEKFKQAAGYADGRTLSQVLPKAARDRLQKMLAVGGGSVEQMDGVEPWAVTLSLVLGMTQAMGFRQDQGLDATLMKRAAEAQKTVAGLETVDDQINALDSMPMNEQVSGLDELLAKPQETLSDLVEMHDWWKRGDIKNLDGRMRLEMKQKSPESYRLVNVQRNDAWVPKIEQRLAEPGQDNTLVVVGAMHLLGSDGVVDKLRAKGYTVERICSACK
ncbi:TraB/GumN family protein [Luteimonas sp. SX5]|uniref:TraB/GumN family protein n=1 Tax=Luteimonas galliterrae TaxID=2940486 RepID=A0ABT0MEJ5_9GAMM|nr:TraB/GumN family protein [Luteimonas galliterrae]MCL1633284.1 TraB/GumN family protein [Luteimonas galliterrae]